MLLENVCTLTKIAQRLHTAIDESFNKKRPLAYNISVFFCLTFKRLNFTAQTKAKLFEARRKNA